MQMSLVIAIAADMSLSTVPLALAAPAAVASLAYLDARTGFSYDYKFLGSAFYSTFKASMKERSGRLNVFYMLEDIALGKRGNDRAFVFEGRQWTYKEMYETVLKYGNWLKTRYQIAPKEIVAMDFTNSDKFMFIWLGLWAIGAKPAFINCNLTGKALAHCIRVSTTRLVLVDLEIQHNVTQQVQDELVNVQFETFTLELEAEVMVANAVREDDSTRTENKGQNMAILIYTSGTTGLPKGAVVSWSKILVGTGLVAPWMGFTRKDTFYTVRASITSSLHALMTLVYATLSLLCLCSWILQCNECRRNLCPWQKVLY
jgi:acyl-coenzyme A synthetase/AMP-(fatty) acid ligase